MTKVCVCHFYLFETCLTQQPIKLRVSEWLLEPPSLPFCECVCVCVCVSPAGLCRCQAVLPNSSLTQGPSLPSCLSGWSVFPIPRSFVTTAAAGGDKAVVCHQLHLFPHAQSLCFSDRRDILQRKWNIGKLDLFSPQLYLPLNYFGFCIKPLPTSNQPLLTVFLQ